MINRELIRLKVLQLVYAYYQNDGKTLDVVEKELMFSMDKGYELYLYLLSLLLALQKRAAAKDESAQNRQKRLGTSLNGLTPDGRFAANLLLEKLAENEQLIAYLENQKKEWVEEEPFVKRLYDAMTESDIFDIYLKKEDFSFEADRELMRKLYKTFVCENDDFAPLIEDHSLYWNDDKEVVDSFVLKTIKRFTAESTPQQPLLPKFASEDDRQFAIRLMRETIARAEETRGLIRGNVNAKKWDFKRIALMDLLIAQIAITEVLTFPSIPLNVSINEYLDIAKIYSTPRSAGYLNGMLDGIFKKLKADGKLLK